MGIDVIGDVHGCYDELCSLLTKLGYERTSRGYHHPKGRKVAFIGDLTDRGPHSLAVIELVASLVKENDGYYVPGNHCNKLYRFFLGRNVKIQHGLETTIAEWRQRSEKEQQRIKETFLSLYEHAPLYDEIPSENLVIAHAGMKEEYIGLFNKRVETFVLYGDITGEVNPDGTPVRRDWARHYNGKRWIVYGHTPVQEPRMIHRTINIDTGCVFGGALTSVSFPERKTTSVPSNQPYVQEKFRTF